MCFPSPSQIVLQALDCSFPIRTGEQGGHSCSELVIYSLRGSITRFSDVFETVSEGRVTGYFEKFWVFFIPAAGSSYR